MDNLENNFNFPVDQTVVPYATGPLTMNKIVDKATGVVGDILTYAITITNPSGSGINAAQIVLQDTMPAGTQLVPGSLIIDGAPNTGDIQAGVSLSDLAPGASHQIIFKVVVTTFPNGVVKNDATINYVWGQAGGSGTPNKGGNVGQAQTVPGPDTNGKVYITKSVDKTTANVGDTITYTLSAINIGSVTVNNVTVSDTIPNGTSYVANSTQVNGGAGQNLNPQSGINFGTLSSGQAGTATFKVLITTTPNPNPIPNQALLSFQYTNNGQTLTANGGTGFVYTTVNTTPTGTLPNMSIIKAVDKTTANVGDNIQYTVVVTNNGTVNYTNLYFVDTTPNGATFVNGSVSINGASQTTLNPQTGFNITPPLNVGQVATITWNVTTNTIPTPNPMVNVANAIATAPGGKVSGLTNAVSTLIQQGSGGGGSSLTKLVDKAQTTVGSTITYTSVIKNTGSVPLTNVVFTDTLESTGLTFVPGTFTVNGAATTANPTVGASVPSIAVGGAVTVTFQVLINTIPVPNPIPNISNVTYTFIPIGSTIPQNAQNASNAVSTLVTTPGGVGTAVISKTVDKTTALVKDIVTYTLFVVNTGTIPINNVTVSDTIPNGASYLGNSTVINNGVAQNLNPQAGINIGTLNPNGVATITFKAIIDTIPSPNPMVNTGTTTFQYTNNGSIITGNATSGPVSTLVSQITVPSVYIVKSVDLTSATVGQTVTYTAVVGNNGSVNYTQFTFTDTTPNGGTFVPGSVTINGVVNGTANPQTGFNITPPPNMGQVATVTWQVVITTIPSPNPMPNTARGIATFSGGNIPCVSNTVSTLVTTTPSGAASTSIVKAVDKTTANVGQTVTYTSVITNTGSLPLTNVIFTDTIQATGVTFVSGSVLVNGASNMGNPSSGINVGNLAIGQVATVVWTGTINSVPVPNPIPNVSVDTYTFTPSGSTIPQNGGNTSNLVNTVVPTTTPGGGSASIVKAVDKTTANVGQTVTYTSVITNTGSVPLTNVVFTDTLQATGIAFVPGTFTLNGAATVYDPTQGVTIPSLAVGASQTVTFQVIINTIPVPNPIPNNSGVTYTFTPTGSTIPQNGSNTSNQVNTVVPTTTPGGASTSIVKAVDKTTANVGQTVTYTSVITNTGSLALTNVIFTDTIQATGVSFVSGSVLVNGASNMGNPSSGINVGNLAIGQVATVVWTGTINSVPVPNPIPNVSVDTYTFTPSGSTIPQNGGNTSNLVNTVVPTTTPGGGSASIVKAVDKTSANVGQTVTYTSVITNTGSLPLTNVVFTDTLQAAGIAFVPGTFTLNGAATVYDPTQGVTIPSLAVGASQTVTFQVIINTIPVPNPIPNNSGVTYTFTPTGSTIPQNGSNSSNQVNTVVPTTTPGGASTSIVKAVDKTTANVGQTVTYTSVITNTGSLALTNVIFTDTIQATGVTFVSGSVLVNGASNMGNPSSGINIGNLAIGQVATVVWTGTINAVPVPNPIPNTSADTYTFTPSGSTIPQNGGNTSNLVNTVVPTTTPGGGSASIVKAVDKTSANVGQTVTYTSVITNTGSLPLTNVVFTDTLQATGIAFVPGTFTLNGAATVYDPTQGVTIPSLAVGASQTVTFQVIINTIPVPNPIPNNSGVTYTFTPTGSTIPQNGSNSSNQVNTVVPTTTPGGGSASIVKAVDKTSTTVGSTVTYTSVITNTGSVPLTNVVFTDTLQSTGTIFVPGSVVVNGASGGGNPSIGITVPDLAIGQSATIVFQVLVNTIPVPNPIPNTSGVAYTFTPSGSTIPQNGSNTSNLVNTNVTTVPSGSGSASISKAVDKTTVNVGQTITYTLAVTNTGAVNLTNLLFVDPIQSSGVSFVPGTFKVNGATASGDPTAGVNLGTLPVGSVDTVTFQVLVTTIPVPNPIPNTGAVNYTFIPVGGTIPQTGNAASNNVTTSVSTVPSGGGSASIVKAVDKTSTTVGSTITYTSVITNTGSLPLSNMIFADILQVTGVTFVPNSMTVNGTPNSGNPLNGVSIPDLAIGAVSTIIFQVIVNTIPVPNPIPNISGTSYTYIPVGSTIPQTGNVASNRVTTNVTTVPSGGGSASIIKAVDKTSAIVGQTVTYTSVIINTGSLPLTNVIFTDTLQATGISFVPNSATVNGASSAGDPSTGIVISNLGIGQIATITFQGLINTIPNPNPIPNNSSVGYTYTPVGGSPTNGNSSSNTVNTLVSLPSGTGNANIVKAVDKTNANVGDNVTYTSVITNTGSLPLTNVIFTDTLQATGVSYVANSLMVNGVSNLGNPLLGVNLGGLAVGASVTISFNAQITTLPTPNPIPNTSNVGYTYTPNGGTPITGTKDSNLVNTLVTLPSIGSASITKSVDKTSANVGDTITYTAAMKNTGSLPLTNVIFTDTIQSNNVAIVPNSTTINGVPNGGDVTNGIALPDIQVGGTVTVVFKVILNKIPTPNPMPNTAIGRFNYTLNNGQIQTGTTTSNTVTTNVTLNPGTGSARVVKSVDKTQAQVGNIINYTSVITNTGSLPLSNIMFTDILQGTNTSFVQGSLIINGVASGNNPVNGVAIPNLNINEVATVNFSVNINGLPTPNPIPNTSGITYIYTPNGGNPTNGNQSSNTVNTSVTVPSGSGSATIVKSVDKTVASIGDTVTYNSVITNTGTLLLQNVMFMDNIQSANVTFVPGSLTVNGVSNLGNPISGVQVSDIPVGGTANISFKAVINNMPVPNPIPNTSNTTFTYTPVGGSSTNGNATSNQVQTLVNQGQPITTVIKQVNKTIANIGDTLTYTLIGTNTGTVAANNVIIQDTPPLDTTFVQGSVVVNGMSNPSADVSSGVNIGTLAPGQTVILTYNVNIVQNRLPNPNPILNSADLSYSYQQVPGGAAINVNVQSNTVQTNVNAAIINPGTDPNPGVIKSVDKAVAQIGDTLTYTVNVKNSGNIQTQSAIFIDAIPSGTTYVNGSLEVNGVSNSGNPTTGFDLGALAPGQTAQVMFKVTVTGNAVNVLQNRASLTYTYVSNPSNPIPTTKTVNSNIVTTNLGTNPINPSTGVVKTVDKAYAKLSDTLNYTVTVSNTSSITAANVFFKDTIPKGLIFVPNSIIVNGTPMPGVNPNAGFNIGNINPNAKAVITFQAVVESIPNPNPAVNIANIDYSYQLDPSQPAKTANASSNPVSTNVNQGSISNTDGGLVKTVDKTYAQIGDILTYTVTAKNTGNVQVNNVVLTDIIPGGTSLVPGTVMVNGVSNASLNPSNGISLGSIPPNGFSVVVFKVKITQLPAVNPIPNSATVNYSYTVNPNNPNSENVTNVSNTVNTGVNQANINPSNGLVKSVDKAYAKVSDNVTYTIGVTNSGNINADNVMFYDTIPNGTSFVINSLTVDGGIIPGANPSNGVNIGSILPNQTKTITFKVTVLTIPNPNPIPNNSRVTYTYIYNPVTGAILNASTNSNTVTTKVNEAIINPANGDIVKSVDKAYAKVKDSLTYTVVIQNSGNTTANNVVFYDTIPSGTTFTSGSVNVNGMNIPLGNPQNGVGIGNIVAGGQAIISFNVIVNTIPTINPIPNNGFINFNYIVDPVNDITSNKTSKTNTVYTTINEANFSPDFGGIQKTVDKTSAKLNDVLTYTVYLNNKGNVKASNVVVTDVINQGLKFIDGSVTVNGVSQASSNPNTGINIGTINPNAGVVITFKASVIALPTVNPIPNNATVDFAYTVNPDNPNGQIGKETSNTVKTQINSASISTVDGGLNKQVDKKYAQIGDTLNYTIILKNTGNTNATGVIVEDTIPQGTTFMQGSVTINGLALVNANPVTGVNIGVIKPGEVVDVSYKVTVIGMPNPNPIPNVANVTYNFVVDTITNQIETDTNKSNTVLTTVNTPNINPEDGSLSKIVDKAYAMIGETLTYSIFISNEGNVVATNVVVLDTIPEGTRFVENSVKINNVLQTGANPSLGVNVGNIAAGNMVELSYNVLVYTIPMLNPIPNKANVSYVFTMDPAYPNGVQANKQTNTVKTQVNDPNISNGSGGIIKSADKQYATLGDVITYTVSLRNNGNVPSNNVMFFDTIPQGTVFVQGSTKVNGVGTTENPQTGVNIGTIVPAETTVISFKVSVVGNVNVVNNKGTVNYTFTKNPATPNGQKVSNNSNQVQTVINTASISNVDGGLIKSVDKAFVKLGDTITYTISLKNTGNTSAQAVQVIDTIPIGTSFVDGSVKINGIINMNANPSVGINVPAIDAGSLTTVTFQVVATTLPSNNLILNTAEVKYKYLVDPILGVYVNGDNLSNTVKTNLNSAVINPNNGDLIKKVDLGYADLNDVVTYTIGIRNSGNTAAINVVFKDTIPPATSFVSNSVTVNGNTVSGANPQTGISLSPINPNEISTVTFKVTVTSIPTPNVVNNSGAVTYSYIVNPINQVENTGAANTNIVTTTINSGVITGGVTKTVDKQYAQLGDNLTYTIKIKNTGNTKINNVVLLDTPPSGTSFVGGSVLINGAPNGSDNILGGINVGNLDPSAETMVSYRVLVVSIPLNNPIKNTANINYNYTVNPENPNGKTGSATSNTVITQINYAEISGLNGGAIKSVDKSFADIGEELLYTITIKNTGNVSANNIVIKDTIPGSTTFIPNSVLVNNSSVIGGNPQNGINIGMLKPNDIATIAFKVLVQSIPSGNNVLNDATINYSYTKDPSYPNGEVGNTNTNTVKTEIRTGQITPGTIIVGPNGNTLPASGGFIKTVDKSYAQVGDTVTYSFKVTNTGNVSVNDVTLTDLIPKGMNFVDGSFTIDGVIVSNANGTVGVDIGTIGANKSRAVSFKVLVVSVPDVNPVKNMANLTYTYIVDANKSPIKKSVNSNIAQININSAQIDFKNGGLIKQVDKEFAELNDILTYSIKVENTGNVRANNVVINDTIPEGTEFVNGSVKINGDVMSTLNPQTGIGLLVLDPGVTNSIEFKVKVIKLNPNFRIENNCVVQYEFLANPNELPISKSSISNTVVTKENSADFTGTGFTKMVSEKFVNIGDIVSYTFRIQNKGNILATNVSFLDTIANGLSFVNGSVMINNISFINANPNEGISLGSIGSGVGLTLTFEVKVVDLPATNPIVNIAKLTYVSQVNPSMKPVIQTIDSNKQEITVKDPKLSLFKWAMQTEVVVSDIVDYKIKVSNYGNVDALSIQVIDTLSKYLDFVKGSVVIDGVSAPKENITSGITINMIKAGTDVLVEFKAIVIDKPSDGMIENMSKGIFTYVLNPLEPAIGEQIYSNKVIIHAEKAELQITKDSDLNVAKLDDIITYNVTIKNVGTLKALNVAFIDTLPQEVALIDGSFTVNGREINSINIQSGVSLGDLDVGETFNVQYKVIVKKVCCDRKIINDAFAKFDYKVKNNSPIKEKESKKVSKMVIGQSPSFRQMNVDGMLTLVDTMPPIEEVNEVKATIEITNQYVIETARGTSNENAKLTGYKLVINGYIHETIEYTALNTSQSNHYTCSTKKFSTFIILQEDYRRGSDIQINSLVEDVLFSKISEDTIYTNVTFNLDATVVC